MTKSLDQILSNRRTTRHFNPAKPITQTELIPLLEAARLAPSAKNFQPLRYVVVLSEHERNRLHAISEQAWFYKAPSYIVVIGDHNKAWQRTHCDLTYVDASIALTQMLLKAAAMGLGATTVAAFDQDLCRELLQIPAHEEPILILAVGYPDPAFIGKEGNPQRKTMEELVSFI